MWRSWHILWVAVVAAALLAPWVYWGLHAWAAGAEWAEVATFGRVFNRVLMAAVAVALLLALPSRGYRGPSDFGFGGGRGAWASGLSAFGIGVALVAGLAALHLGMGARVWDRTPELGAGVAAGIVATAVVVAGLEEALFRGVLLGETRARMGVVWAVGLQALVYAAVHFLRAPGFEEGYRVAAWSGFELLGAWPSQFVVAPETAVHLATLFFLGVLLGAGAVASGGVWWPFGLHAGVILAQQVAGRLLDYRETEWAGWLARDMAAGVDAAVLMMLAAAGKVCYELGKAGRTAGGRAG